MTTTPSNDSQSAPRQLMAPTTVKIAFNQRVLDDLTPQGTERLAAWGKRLDPDWPDLSDIALDGTPQKTHLHLLRWCLAFSAVVTRELGYPCFAAPKLNSVNYTLGQIVMGEAQINFPAMPQSGTRALHKVLTDSQSFVVWAMAHDATPQSEAAFFARIEEELAQPLKNKTGEPKSQNAILREAFRRGTPFRYIGNGTYQLGWGSGGRYVRGAATVKESSIGATLAQRKSVCTGLFRQAGLPAPGNRACWTLAEAEAFAAQVGWPVVVKPDDRDAGMAVNIVENTQDLKAAFDVAKAASAQGVVLTEEFVKGICHRLFVAGGEVIYVVRRKPIGQTADGVRSVADLITGQRADDRCQPPWRRSGLPELDTLAINTLTGLGFSLTDVPKKGTFLPLRPRESTAWGGVDDDLTAETHAENKRIACQAAELVGLSIVGVDIITNDISTPWYETGAMINEVNHLPTLGLADISKGYLTQCWDTIFDHPARIPVEVFVGGSGAWEAAQKRQAELSKNGRSVFLTNADITLGASGEDRALRADGLTARVNALLLSKDVDGLIVVGEFNQIIRSGLGLEGVDDLQVVDPEAALTELDENILAAWVWPKPA
ncbi:MAG: hypothetical protein AAF641_01150 [Pseudomonadota bacterium]